MKKYLFIFIIIMLLCSNAWADSKGTALSEVTDVQGSDFLYIIDDPSGTPASKKITVTNLFDIIDTSAELYGILTDETGTGGGTPLAVFNYNPTLTGFTLAADADFGDYDITSIDGLFGYDAGVSIDLGADGRIIISADGAGTPFSTPDIDITGSVYFDDDIGLALDKALQFGDANVFIESDDDGYLDLDADTGIRLNANTAVIGQLSATTYGSDGSISDAELKTIDDGATTQIIVGGGAGSAPIWGTDIPTAVTIGSAYIYRAGGTDVPIADGGTGAGTAAAAKAALDTGLPSKSFAVGSRTASDDFLLWRAPVAITITDIYGVLLTGTNVVGGLDECDSNGANCVAVDSDITFDGSLDQDDGTLTNGTIDAGDWIMWHTTSVDSPGYLTVTFEYTID